MSRILIVAYYFPPLGLGGVQRTMKFVRYLPEWGWDPIVFTSGNLVYHAHDATLESEIQDIKVVRSGAGDPLHLLSRMESRASKKHEYRKGSSYTWINKHLLPWFLVPDSKILWSQLSRKKALELIRTEKPEVLMTTSPPHSSHLLGMHLKNTTGLPWIADFRDNWLAEAYEKHPTPLHRMLNRRLVGRVVRNADRVLAVSETILYDLKKFDLDHPEKFRMIPNGYDAIDFHGKIKSKTESFIVTHAGTLNTTRSPKTFLKAAALVLTRNPDLRNRIRFRFIGAVTGFDLSEMVKNLSLEDVVDIQGYLSHQEAVQAILDSSLLLLLISGDSSPGVITGKLYEYLASGVPILAAVPDGESAELVLKHERGQVVRPDSVEAQADALMGFYHSWLEGRLRPVQKPLSGIEYLDRRRQTQELAQILDVSTKIVRKYLNHPGPHNPLR